MRKEGLDMPDLETNKKIDIVLIAMNLIFTAVSAIIAKDAPFAALFGFFAGFSAGHYFWTDALIGWRKSNTIAQDLIIMLKKERCRNGRENK
jgi:hypothetical protein